MANIWLHTHSGSIPLQLSGKDWSTLECSLLLD